ncbi:MAG: InlB B-repeat-containing protein, partial [Erysipelotrichaceae bacterium]|nr:InlB B-repeat-containing protein [Erysipelotrichaceae bacterium]
MGSLFSHCTALNSVNLSSFNTRAVNDMQYMFNDCKKLTSLDLSGFDTSNVEYMQNMFSDSSSLTSLDLSGFDTRLVKRIDLMFDSCTSLASLDVSNFDTGQVSGSEWSKNMFRNCGSLQSINLSSRFFNGAGMDGADLCASDILWMQADHTDNRKTWPELVQSWKDADTGWWKIVKYDVTFNTSGGSRIPALEKENGGSLNLSQYVPAKEGYDFTGWYLDESCQKEADSVIVVKEPVTLYAGWNIQKKKLSFDSMGGSKISPVTADYGSKIDLNSYVPVRKDSGWFAYSFTGWFTDSECTHPAGNRMTLNGDTTLYAGWKESLRQVSKENCGEKIGVYDIKPGYYIMSSSAKSKRNEVRLVKVVDVIEELHLSLMLSYGEVKIVLYNFETGNTETVEWDDVI